MFIAGSLVYWLCALLVWRVITSYSIHYTKLYELCEKPLGLTLANQDRFDALTGERNNFV